MKKKIVYTHRISEWVEFFDEKKKKQIKSYASNHDPNERQLLA